MGDMELLPLASGGKGQGQAGEVVWRLIKVVWINYS